MKYISAKKSLVLLALSTLVHILIWALPSFFENMLFQKIVFILFALWGFILALLFFFINGGVWSVTDGDYEKEYYRSLKEGKAVGEGENLRYNPLNLSLCKRIYYSKILVCLIFSVILVFAFEYISIILQKL